MNWLSVLFSRRRSTALLLSTALLSLAFGHDRFVAIQPEQTAQYHMNFARLFFASPEAEKAERAELEATLKDLESLKGRLKGPPIICNEPYSSMTVYKSNISGTILTYICEMR